MKISNRRTKIELIILAVLLALVSWYLFMGKRITDATDEVIPGRKDTSSLVVYFSRAGEIPGTVDAVSSATPNTNREMDGSDTEAAAKMIQQLTGADLFQIRTEKYYRNAFWGTAATAWIEEALDLRPGLAGKPEEQQDTEAVLKKTQSDKADISPEAHELADVTEGTEVYRDFVIDNVYHSADAGDIHYNVYIPKSYDGSRPYALYFTLPGYGGLYFQGVAANIKSEEFGFEAQKYNDEMIIVAPQLNDWGETSADQTITLVEYFLQQYNIDTSKVYGNGYSGGGETMSIVMGKRPDLFTAYLHVSSQWDGEYEPVVDNRLPVYFAIGRDDEYYGSVKTQRAYDTLYDLYERQGLLKEEIDRLLVLDIKEQDYFTERNAPNEHGGGGFFAYDEEIMGWLFSF